MKKRSSRNRTLTIVDSEKNDLMRQVVKYNKPASIKETTNKVVCQDLFSCLDFLPEDFVDLLIIDPPYNLTKSFGERNFVKTKPQVYKQWFESWLVKLKKTLKQTASIYICCDWQSSTSIHAILEQHFVVRNRITWEREKGRGSKTNWKNNLEDIYFCTVSNDYFFNVDAVKLNKKVVAPYRNSNGTAKDWKEVGGEKYRLTHPSNLWTDITIPFWSMSENTDHPTQKPEKLIAKLILASSKESDFVFDPFVGSGTTCVVAKKLGRKYLGIEQEVDYCQMSVKRRNLASQDKNIQGYSNGIFWDRNTIAQQNKLKNK